MKMTFRWYGENDPVTLEKIKQIPLMDGIVSAIYDVPVGEIWDEEKIIKLKETIINQGLDFSVVESVPVHEEIKLGTINAQKFIDNYCENIRLLGKHGVKVICYNFMPVFDWLRSNLSHELSDGSFALTYDNETVLSLDPNTSDLSLPGWDESYTKKELKVILDKYKGVDENKLWDNLKAFLEKVIPVAKENNVLMAIHPDDPPWGIFNLPRIIINEQNLDKFLKLYDEKENGLTFCTGSLGVLPDNDIIHMIDKYTKMDRVHFVHLRNVKITGERCFFEVPHPSSYGSLDMGKIIKVLYDNNFSGFVRPDHGRMIWGEVGKPGYGLFDRALGAMYINGLWEGVQNG